MAGKCFQSRGTANAPSWLHRCLFLANKTDPHWICFCSKVVKRQRSAKGRFFLCQKFMYCSRNLGKKNSTLLWLFFHSHLEWVLRSPISGDTGMKTMENLDIPVQAFLLSLLGVVIDCFASISYWEYSILIFDIIGRFRPAQCQGMDEPDGTSRILGMGPGAAKWIPEGSSWLPQPGRGKSGRKIEVMDVEEPLKPHGLICPLMTQHILLPLFL